MQKTTFLLGLSAIFLSAAVNAHNLRSNANLPAVSVQQEGEILVKGNDVAYQPWQSNSLAGKVRVLQHMAGRSSVKEKNEALINAIKAAHFSPAVYQTTTIINADDAVFGTGPFVKSSAEKGKKANAHSQVVLDKSSAVKNAWALKEKESLILVLDKSGKVQFAHEGQLNPQQIEQVIELVKKLTN